MKNLIKYTLVCCTFAFVLNTQAQGALDLDGGNDFVNLGTNISLGDYTKEAWVNWGGDTNYQNNILSGNDADSPHAFWFPGTSGGKLSAGHSGSFTIVQDPVAMDANVWVHIAVTYNATSGEIILYKNGNQVASAIETPGFVSSVFYIGSFNFGYFYNGMIDDVRLWSTVRTPAEIAANYNQCLTGSEAGLVALYKFEDGTGSSIASDSTANGHDGTLSNMDTSTDWVNSSNDVCIANSNSAGNELYVENSAVSKSPNETNSVGGWNVDLDHVGDITLTTSTDSNKGNYSLEAQAVSRYKGIRFATNTLFETGKTYTVKFSIKGEKRSTYAVVEDGFSYVHCDDRPGSTLVAIHHLDEYVNANEWTEIEFEVTSDGSEAVFGFSPGSGSDVSNHKAWLSEFSVEEKIETDNTAPDAPVLSSSANTDVTTDLSWTAATDDVAVTGYKIYKDGVLEATQGNVLAYQAAGLTAETAYNFTVTAIDAADNESVASNTVTVTTDASTDTEAPVAGTLSSTDVTTTTVSLSWTAATDNVGINAYRIYRGSTYLATRSNVTFTYTDTDLTPDTSYDYTITALDFEGNVSDASNLVTVTTLSTGGGAPTELYTENSAVSNAPNEDNSIGSWNDTNGGTLTISTDSNSGQYSFQQTGTNGQIISVSPAVALFEIGKRYKFIFKMKGTDTSAGAAVVTGFDNVDTYGGNSVAKKIYQEGGNANEWVTIRIDGDFNGSSPYILLDPITNSGGGSETVWLSEFSITELANTADPDTETPLVGTLSSGTVGNTAADLSWTAATDNTGVTGYKVFKNDVLEVTLGDVLAYQATGLTAETAYNFTVTALDASGNESSPSNEVTITTTGGGTPSDSWNINGQNLYYNSGNVGIGTTTPDEKLAVNGSIHSQEVRVDLLNWPDYVFEDTYKLPSLNEVENHIKQNGHLINIPSAETVHQNGLKLGYINAKLLEKIEELTLYTIQQQKEIEMQKSKNEDFEARLKAVERFLKQ